MPPSFVVSLSVIFLSVVILNVIWSIGVNPQRRVAYGLPRKFYFKTGKIARNEQPSLLFPYAKPCGKSR